MPYILKSERDALHSGAPIASAGQLNYCISKLIQGYIRTKGLSYATLNDIVGALEASKLEFYRRVVVPYEEQKKAENGDLD